MLPFCLRKTVMIALVFAHCCVHDHTLAYIYLCLSDGLQAEDEAKGEVAGGSGIRIGRLRKTGEWGGGYGSDAVFCMINGHGTMRTKKVTHSCNDRCANLFAAFHLIIQ